MTSISKSVNEYYEYKRYQFERIDKFIEENLTCYATKHNIDIAGVIELFEKGMRDGNAAVQSELKDRSLISSEAGKLYLFEIATIFNIQAHYLSSKTKNYLKKGNVNFVTIHDPQVILAAGNEIANINMPGNWC